MNIKELIKVASKESGIPQKEIQVGVDAFLKATIDSVKKGYDISIVNLLTIKTVYNKEKTSYSPSTGKTITIPARWNLKANLSRKLVEFVKNKPFYNGNNNE